MPPWGGGFDCSPFFAEYILPNMHEICKNCKHSKLENVLVTLCKCTYHSMWKNQNQSCGHWRDKSDLIAAVRKANHARETSLFEL